MVGAQTQPDVDAIDAAVITKPVAGTLADLLAHVIVVPDAVQAGSETAAATAVIVGAPLAVAYATVQADLTAPRIAVLAA